MLVSHPDGQVSQSPSHPDHKAGQTRPSVGAGISLSLSLSLFLFLAVSLPMMGLGGLWPNWDARGLVKVMLCCHRQTVISLSKCVGIVMYSRGGVTCSCPRGARYSSLSANHGGQSEAPISRSQWMVWVHPLDTPPSTSSLPPSLSLSLSFFASKLVSSTHAGCCLSPTGMR